MLLVYCLVAVVLVALALAIYSDTGRRAWFGTRETPEEIIGRSVQLTDFDGLGASPTPSPTAIIADHEASNYRAEFSRLFMVDGREEGFAWLRARHTGYPVSGAQRRATFVNGSLESGRRFIARIRVL
jgi:hypothetical protein